ncbi:hypothetical protein N9J26_01085 [bacterium]|nr:hypothetical protein [bacterium]
MNQITQALNDKNLGVLFQIIFDKTKNKRECGVVTTWLNNQSEMFIKAAKQLSAGHYDQLIEGLTSDLEFDYDENSRPSHYGFCVDDIPCLLLLLYAFIKTKKTHPTDLIASIVLDTFSLGAEDVVYGCDVDIEVCAYALQFSVEYLLEKSIERGDENLFKTVFYHGLSSLFYIYPESAYDGKDTDKADQWAAYCELAVQFFIRTNNKELASWLLLKLIVQYSFEGKSYDGLQQYPGFIDHLELFERPINEPLGAIIKLQDILSCIEFENRKYPDYFSSDYAFFEFKDTDLHERELTMPSSYQDFLEATRCSKFKVIKDFMELDQFDYNPYYELNFIAPKQCESVYDFLSRGGYSSDRLKEEGYTEEQILSTQDMMIFATRSFDDNHLRFYAFNMSFYNRKTGWAPVVACNFVFDDVNYFCELFNSDGSSLEKNFKWAITEITEELIGTLLSKLVFHPRSLIRYGL